MAISSSPIRVPASITPSVSSTSWAKQRLNNRVSRYVRFSGVSGPISSSQRPRTGPDLSNGSSSLTISSCATSTSRRVRYPESAVLSAVSTRPLRAPGVEMKYSSIARPSRYEDLIGRGMMSPRGLATKPLIAAIWRTCIMLPRAPDPTIMSMGLNMTDLSSRSRDARTSSVAEVQISTSF